MAGQVRQILAAGIMVFRLVGQKLEYLSLQASNLNHHWTPPKGHVDPGETDLVAAQRETKEEAGLSPDDYDIIPDFQATVLYTAWQKSKRVIYWSARVKNPDVPIIISDEHMAFRWCDLQTTLAIGKENMREPYCELDALLRKKYFLNGS